LLGEGLGGVARVESDLHWDGGGLASRRTSVKGELVRLLGDTEALEARIGDATRVGLLACYDSRLGQRCRERVVEGEGELSTLGGTGPMKEGTPAEGVVGVGGVVDIVLEGPVADRLGVKAAVCAAVERM
jgi:hypothetical protein